MNLCAIMCVCGSFSRQWSCPLHTSSPIVMDTLPQLTNKTSHMRKTNFSALLAMYIRLILFNFNIKKHFCANFDFERWISLNYADEMSLNVQYFDLFEGYDQSHRNSNTFTLHSGVCGNVKYGVRNERIQNTF